MKLLLPAMLGMAFAGSASADNPGEWGGHVTDAYAFASITTDSHALQVVCKNNVVTIAYYVLPEKLQAELKATEQPFLVVAFDEGDLGAGKVAAIGQSWTRSEKNWSLGLSGKPAKALVKKMATARNSIVVGIARVSPDLAQYKNYEVERLTARGSGKYLKPILARCS